MGLLFGNHIRNAVEALKANRLRTNLTIIGVTIGITSITASLALAGGASNFLSEQVKATNNKVALIRSHSLLSSPDSLLADFNSLRATTTLTEEDVNSLSNIPNASVAPIALLHANMKARDNTVTGEQSVLIGSNSNLIDIANLKLLDGQFLSENNGTNGIVIGNQLAVDLFGTEHAIGSLVTIRDQTFAVIGTLEPTGQPINYHGVDFDRAAIIQLDSLKGFTQDVAQIQQIILATDESQPLGPVVEQANKVLSDNHQGEKDFVILTDDEITAPSGQLFTAISTTVAVITGISLLVGGIGIMNIMLVNVAERNREVGIRKAIGASNSNIISQFLIESSIIGLLGGIIGYIVGMLAAYILSMYLPFMPTVQWQVAAISIGTAVLTGVVFGIYPAVRAARKDPIEALHQ